MDYLRGNDLYVLVCSYFSSVVNVRDITISSCNADCMCTSSVYEPVCGADNITYFSPCRAGCMKRPDENDSSVSPT